MCSEGQRGIKNDFLIFNLSNWLGGGSIYRGWDASKEMESVREVRGVLGLGKKIKVSIWDTLNWR